jgi:hypothetical protein
MLFSVELQSPEACASLLTDASNTLLGAPPLPNRQAIEVGCFIRPEHEQAGRARNASANFFAGPHRRISSTSSGLRLRRIWLKCTWNLSQTRQPRIQEDLSFTGFASWPHPASVG